MPEPRPGAGAVDPGGLVQVPGDVLQRGEIDQHLVGECRPGRQHDQRRQRRCGVAQPVDLHAGAGQKLQGGRERPVGDAVERRPDRRHHRHRQQERQERDAAEERPSGQTGVQRQGRGQRKGQLQRHHHHREGEGVAAGLPELRVGQHPGIVAQADEAGRHRPRHQPLVGDREPDRQREGQDHQPQQRQQRRRQHGDLLGTVPGARSAPPRRGLTGQRADSRHCPRCRGRPPPPRRRVPSVRPPRRTGCRRPLRPRPR